MATLFDKLNLKNESCILILNAPEGFESALSELKAARELMQKPIEIRHDADGMASIPFALAFVTTAEARDAASRIYAEQTEGDVVLWLAYPKKTSRKFSCEFNRDSGWEVLGAAGFEPVRMVAIDDDWSALRFRRTAFIKSITRSASFAQSAEGKARTSGK